MPPLIEVFRVVDWRDVPLLTALSYGVMSVEADVWLENGTLYVNITMLHCVIALTTAS